MPRAPAMARQRLKIHWIEDKKKRQAALRKRRATLLEKAKELSTLCDIAVAVVVYCHGNPVPVTWPSPEETKEILERYVALPDFAKAQMNVEAFLRKRVAKVVKTLKSLRLGNRDRHIDIYLNEISLGRRHSLNDLTPELAVAVQASYVARLELVARCINKGPVFQATSVAAAAPEAGAALVQVPQEPPVAPPPVMAPVVADALTPLLPGELDGQPCHGSFLVEMVQAIMDDGSGRNSVPTVDDMMRIMMEHDRFVPQ
jgi:hypothetical protein